MRWRQGTRGTSPWGSGTPPGIGDTLGFGDTPGNSCLPGVAPCSEDVLPAPRLMPPLCPWSRPPPYPGIRSPPRLWGHPPVVRFCSPWIRVTLWDLPPGVGVSLGIHVPSAQLCGALRGYSEDLRELLGGLSPRTPLTPPGLAEEAISKPRWSRSPPRAAGRGRTCVLCCLSLIPSAIRALLCTNPDPTTSLLRSPPHPPTALALPWCPPPVLDETHVWAAWHGVCRLGWGRSACAPPTHGAPRCAANTPPH